jgi:hypothetical protein
MLRIFLILSLAVALAGLGFSFFLRDKVQSLTEQRDLFGQERDAARAEEARAREAEQTAVAAEKATRDQLEVTQQELTATTARLNETEGQLARRSQELQDTIVERDTAQRRLARWDALGIEPDEIAALQALAARLREERDAFAEEKKVMGREIARLNEELNLYRIGITEVQMADVRGRVTGIESNFGFVTLDVGTDDGLKRHGKMIVTRDGNLVAKVQLVRVDPSSSVANLLPEWGTGQVQVGDQVMTSYEALATR